MRASPFLRFVPFGLALGSGCSLLGDFDLSQCETTDDCRSLGDAFAGTVCEEQLCVTPDDSGSGGNGSGGSDGLGGMGGDEGEPECTSNGQCIDENFGSPFICRDGSCVALTIPGECPIVLGAGQDNENLRKPAPILFGAYSYIDPTAPRISVPTLNYELAIDEINEATRGGIPGGPGGTLRPFVAIVCSGTNEPDLDASLSHLIDDVGVPAIISSLYTTDLLDAFTTKGLPNDVFFLSPLESDTTLTQLPDDGLLWHMLAAATDLSPAYVPLLADTEAYYRTEHALAVDEDLRVALVDAKTPFLTDMADDLVTSLEFNGLPALDAGNDANFLRVRIDSDLEVGTPDTTAALASLEAFQPHVVIALTSGEGVLLINDLEANWDSLWGPRPFYLTSPYVFGRSDLASVQLSGIHSRLLGVNFAAAEDSTLYDSYLDKLEGTYDVDFSLEGSENFYDTAYFLMYSIVGAGEPPRLTGKEVALGMTRLLDGKTSYDVGTGDVPEIVGTLRGTTSGEISLQGTMGPPDFSTSTGARRGRPSIYCIAADRRYVQNAMTYDADTGILSGSPSCIEGFPE